jgi:hypothetical protein
MRAFKGALSAEMRLAEKVDAGYANEGCNGGVTDIAIIAN